MRLLYNIVFIPISKENTLLVNTLNGLMDIVDQKSIDVINIWQNECNIQPKNGFENVLYEDLNKRGYLINSYEDERKQKDSILSQLKKQYRNEQGKFTTLAFVLTYDCNFRCPYCYEDRLRTCYGKLSHEMVNAACEIITSETKNILLFGGEPLLLDNMDLVKYIISKCREKSFTVITNGYTLLEYKSSFENLNVNYIQVTLDGKKEMHDKRRCLVDGSPTFTKIVKGVKSYLESGIKVRIRMNIDDSNLDECLSLQEELLKTYEVYSELFSTELFPVFQTDIKSKQKIYRELYRRNYTSENSELDNGRRIIAKNRPIIDAFINNTTPKPLYSFCYEHGKTLFIDSAGELYSCILSVGKPELSIGTYYPHQSYKINSFFTRNVSNIRECMECKYTFICGGGCPMLLKEYTDVMKPACGRVIQDIHAMIPMISRIKNSNG